MKFSCEKNVILEAVGNVIRVIPAKASTPVLEGILIEIKDNVLCMTGSDTEMSVQTTISVESDESKTFIVNAKTFNEMLGKLENGTVEFEIDEKGILHMVCGVIQYDLPTREAELYPTVPFVEKSKTLKFRKKMLHSMLKQTLFSVAQIETRPILKGVLFDICGNELYIVTTDTFRLSLRNEEFENTFGEDFSFVVPGKAINELVRIMNTDDEEVRLGLASTHAVFEFENTVITTRLLSGEFLKYKTIIPKTFKTEVVLKTEELKRTFERASVLINEKMRTPVRVNFEFDTVMTCCKTPEGSNFYDEIKAVIQGENIEIGLNNKQITDVLSVIETEEITMSLNSPVSSVCIKPVGKENALYIVSPMRLKVN